MDLSTLPGTEKEAVLFLQQRGILPSQRECASGHPMKLYFGEEIFFKCLECKIKKMLRVGNWLENSRLPFVQVIRFLYGWAHELTSIEWCQHELNISKSTAVDWNSYCRNVCLADLQNQPKNKIGGKGNVVEIDEALFVKRTNNAGRAHPPQWVIGGLCRETNNVFLEIVTDRKATTLMKAILDNVEEGSNINMDSWRHCNAIGLEETEFKQFAVDHRFSFSDSSKDAQTKLWGGTKWCKKYRGTTRQHLNLYLVEFLWRRKYLDEDPFDALLDSIAQFWSPEEK